MESICPPGADQKGVAPGERGKVRAKVVSYSGRWNTAGGWKKAVMPYEMKSLAWKRPLVYAITDSYLPVILSPPYRVYPISPRYSIRLYCYILILLLLYRSTSLVLHSVSHGRDCIEMKCSHVNISYMSTRTSPATGETHASHPSFATVVTTAHPLRATHPGPGPRGR